MRADGTHPMQRVHTGYTYPRHREQHWQANRPTDCDYCHTAPATQPHPATVTERPGPFAGVLLVVLFWLVLGSALWAVMGPPLSGRPILVALTVGAFLFTAHRTARRNP